MGKSKPQPKVRIRASERAAFKRCPHKWWWSYRDGYVLRDPERDALWFGTGVHLALARWYCGPGRKRGPEPAETWAEYAQGELAFVKTLRESGDEERIAKYESALELGQRMLEGYRAEYDRDDRWDVIAPERTFSLDVPWGENIWDLPPSTVIATLVGTFDLVYRDRESGRIYLGEHKTAGTISTQHLSIDNQGGTYWAVASLELQRAGVLQGRESIAGITYNFLRKALPDGRPVDAQGYYTNKPTKEHYIAALRQALGGIKENDGKPWEKWTLKELETAASFGKIAVTGERSKVQAKPLFERHHVHRTSEERRTQLLRVQADAQIMEAYRDGTLPLTKNPTRDCRWDCAFFDACELQERGGDVDSLLEIKFTRRDPYADHRKSTDE